MPSVWISLKCYHLVKCLPDIRLFTVLCDNQQTPPPPPGKSIMDNVGKAETNILSLSHNDLFAIKESGVKNASCHKFSHNFWKSLLVK